MDNPAECTTQVLYSADDEDDESSSTPALAASHAAETPTTRADGGPAGEDRARAGPGQEKNEGSVPATTAEAATAAPRFVGLSNQGATCYMNSLLQTLYMTPEVRRACVFLHV